MLFPVRYLFIMFIINGPFSSIFQFTVYSSCLSSINGQFFIHFPVRYLFSMFIIYKWAIFMLFPVRYLFIMFIIYKSAIFIHFPVRYLFIMQDVYHLWMGNFYSFSSSLFIHHVYHQWAIFMHFPARYLFIMFIINGPFSSIFQFTVYSSCLSSMGHFHPFSSSLFIHHVYHL